MGKLEKIKSTKKSTICYIITIVILLALTIGFLAAFIRERNKLSDGSQSDPGSSSPGTETTSLSTSSPISSSATDPSTTFSPTPTPDLLLPSNVLPVHYDLSIVPDHQTNLFTGDVKIEFEVKAPTDVIKIHNYMLNVSNERVFDKNNNQISIKSFIYDQVKQYHVIQLNRQLSEDTYYLSLSFNGSLVGKIVGFYKSNYTTDNNQIRQFSATKFEPTYARQAFPCFDEPNKKATFSISITHDKNLNAISNGVQIDQKSVDEFTVTTVFNKTVKMSTYLVAYVISDFQYKESSTIRGKKVRVFSRPDQVHKTKYALNTAIKTLEFFEEYFKIDYPLEKLDLVALPVFVTGAMENWGIITFRETNLLYSDDGSSATEMKRVAAVIGHELAHMWFGNLVTMDWWDDLWLNEGFASYIEYRGINASEPEWQIQQFFLNDDLHGVMRLDALDSSHPIIQEVNNPDQITEIFDSISYSKGSSVLRMLESAIGSDVFRNGIINYLNNHMWSNAKTQHLWDSIQTINAQNPGVIPNVTDFMNRWTRVKGYPIVEVKRLSTKQLKVSQQKFSLDTDGQKVVAKDESNIWQIHLSYISSDSTGSQLMTEKETTIDLKTKISLDSWIKLNDEENGFYITNYEEPDWRLLINLLKTNHDQLSPTNRAHLIFDISMLAEGGFIKYDLLFDLLSYIKSEDQLIPWLAAMSCMNRIGGKFSASDGGLSMKQFTKEMTQNVYSSLGWQSMSRSGESFQEKYLRSRIISLACESGNQNCLNEAQNRFNEFLNGQQIAPDIREYVYKYGLKSSADIEHWNKVLDLWQMETSSAEKTKLLSALTSVTNAQLLSKLISYSNDPTIINDQDFFTVQQSIAGNSIIGRQLVWNYLRDNWDYLVQRFSANDRRLGTYVSSVCSGFNTKIQLKEMQTFFDAHPDSGAGQNARNQAIEAVKNNIKWLETHEDTVVQWLDSNIQSENPWLNWRLDSEVIPLSYNIDWYIDLSADMFNGSVTIEVNVKKPINYFVLHQKGLKITKSIAYSMNRLKIKKSINTQNSSFGYETNDFWVIPTDSTIRPAIYYLDLEFDGKLSTGLHGLYKSVYTDSNGVSKNLATTQFQSTYARQAFPCYDEPQFKSKFDITVTHSAEYKALSNMPVIERTVTGDTAVTKFDTSVDMVTYLVALVVSEFECHLSTQDSRVRVCGAPGNEKKLDYAMKTTPNILRFYEKDYFEIEYPLPKLDNIAIPDFSAGAMENWGLVTYREVYLFYDEEVSTTRDQMVVCMIISHELAHMWFGNLVTTKWWDDLWLNEGFATYMSYKAVANVEPEWHYDEIFALDELNRVFDADSTPNTHPILADVQNANDISSVFDAITYGKGASILRMLETALGDDYFRTGVKNYLNKYKFQNTLTGDLWTELTEAHPERINVTEIMDSWVRRKGFPVITISRNTTAITIRQELFLKDSSESNSNGYLWKIPVTYRGLGDKTIYSEWLEMSKKTFDLRTDSQLINVNVDQKGLFIVNYPLNDWKQFIKGLNDNTSAVINQLSPLDRSELINDAFYLARSGRLDYEIPLNLSQYLRREDSLIPWTTSQTMFSFIKHLINSDAEIALNYYINGLIAEKYSELGWDESAVDSAQTKRLRTVVLDMACGYQLSECLSQVTQKYADFRSGTKIAPNLLLLVLRYGIKHITDRSDFDFLIEKYRSSISAQERLLYLQGLTSTSDIDLIKELLGNATNEDFVRKHDFFTFLSNIALNGRSGLKLVWDYFRDNYEEIEKRFTLNNSNLGRIVYSMSTRFATETQRQEVLDFFKKYPNAGAGRLDRDKALEVLNTNIKWLKNYKNPIIQWFTNQCPKDVCPWIVYRLNKNIIPLQYYLTIQVNTTSNVFSGSVEIEVKANEDIEYFIVHSADILTIKKTKVFINGSTDEQVVKQSFSYSPLQFLVIRLDKKSPPNTYRLIIDFESDLLLGGLSGLYRSSYERDGKTIGLAASQFQSTSARKAFPCFDEPSFKPQFDITLIHETHNNLTLSNMPIKHESTDSPSKGWITTQYERSVPMVSYLVALLVSDFACRGSIGTENGLGFDIRVCSSSVKEYKLGFALEETHKVFESFIDYLNSSYQLGKSDLIAIPHFSAGAMENWGLVKFRETALLWTEDEDQTSSKMSVTSIIAHELAHMWFGNLLTCEFWGDLWLNEGFASFMEYPAVNYTQPDWDYWDLFVYYDLSGAVSADSTSASKPIVRQINTPSDMSYSSAIVYNKGATIIRMMEFAMGADNFRTGIQQYLNTYSYKTVVTKNLWDSLNATFPSELNTNIYELMDSWTTKAGFPYINITRNADNSLTIIQERYLSNGQKPEEDTLWTIPLSYYTSLDSRDYNIIPLKEKEQTITLSADISGDELIKFNVDYRGMYFVNYPLEDWNKWIDVLVNNTDNIVEKLTPSDRSQFILDSFYLAKANKLPFLTPYDLSKYLVNETHYTPWAMFNSMFSNRYRISMTPYKDSLNSYLSYLTATQYERLGWDDKEGNDVTKRLRALIIQISCGYEYQKCLDDAYSEFTEWKVSQTLAPNVRSSVLNFGLEKSNSSDDFEFVWNQYIKTNGTLKSVYLNALTYSKHKNLLENLLERSVDDRVVSVSDFTDLMSNLAANSNGLQIVWDFFQNNYEMLSRKLSSTQLSTVFTNICTYFGDVSRSREVDNFLKLYPNIGLTNSSRETALNKTIANIEWRREYSDTIGQWLAANGCGEKVCPWSVYRLNPKIKPIQYYPTIQVNVTTNVYNGSVAIEVDAKEAVQYFIVHSSSILNVTNSRVFLNENHVEIPILKSFHYKPNDFWVIQLAQEVEPNIYRLEYEFEGNLLLGGLSGLYRSTYKNKDNETIGLASTQFEFTDARKAFPCFDEPSFKSKFQLTIIHDKHMNTTLSNMPVKSSEIDESLDWVTTSYEPTVPMVSYLVAMVVSDFVCQESEVDGAKVGICASPVQTHKLDYGLNKTIDCLHHLAKDYLQIDYPLPKVDMIGIPDFSYGAMENWGLVTFRESRLLWHPDSETSANKMSTAAVIAHELGHFWFGNLVTCEWWSHFWLNEGFATYMEYKALTYSEPEWGFNDLFLMTDFWSAVVTDSSATTQPLVRTVESAVDIMQYSSAIVYSKGASVIRMLESVMNEENFQKGLQKYLRDNSYGNAVTEDLLTALNEFYPKDLTTNITDLMDSWTTKAGFPYINITKNNDNSYTITQQRFLSNGKQPENKTVWSIPLSYYNSYDKMGTTLEFITSDNQTITITTDSTVGSLIKFNTDCKGFYFVNYPEEDWDLWTEALVKNRSGILSKLTPSDRANFIIDAFFLSRANLLPYVKPLQLARYLVNEKHLTPWTIALETFKQLTKYMFTTEYRSDLMSYLIDLSQPLYEEVGWDDTIGSDTEKRLRSSIIEFICSLYHKPCLETALKEYSKWKSGEKIAPNLLTSTLRYGIRQSTDRSDWDFLWSNKYMTENSTTIKLTYLNALSYTTDPSLIKTLLDRVLDSKLIRTQDIPTVLNYIAANSDALPILWDFYQQNHEKLNIRLTTLQLGTVLNNICNYFTNTSRKQEVENFLNANPSLGVTNYDKNKAIETISANMDWMDRHKEEIGNFLKCGSDSCVWTTFRLNRNVKPVKYYIDFNIDVNENQFNGSTAIEVKTEEEVQYFIVHAAESLNITNTRVLMNDNKQELTINQTFRYIPYEFWVIQMVDTLPINTYRLEFEFESKLSENMNGLYKSQYYKDGEPIGLAASQFQATSARKAFPCFDEPSFKSTFVVTITSDESMNQTMANTKQTKIESNADNTQKRYFEETVPMVTYLLAVVVSDFVCKESDAAQVDGYDLRVCASSVEAHKLDYSLNVSPKLMQYFAKDYLLSDYQLSKVDFVALPDFSAGAMENWGLITFRETAMLWDESESTTANKMSVISVIAHEIAHMWFGNLLTCEWWSDLWLNEGFASYMEYTAVNAVEKDWNYFDLFLMTDFTTAIKADSSSTSHPIIRSINYPQEIPYTSAIIYQKGASILRMIESVMGSQPFQTSLQQYLDKHADETVVTRQLWDAMDVNFPELHNTTIYELMDSWTTKAGFPYLTITRDKSNPNLLTVKQERFLSNGEELDSDTVWTVPLTYYSSLDTMAVKTEFIKTKEETIEMSFDESSGQQLLKLNVENMGFYLVNYPEEDWNKWIKALVDNENNILVKLSVSDRTNFIIDSFLLSGAGLLSYLKPLELSQYLSKETHLTPWSVAIDLFAPLRRYLSNTEYKSDLELYLSALSQNTYNNLGWDDTQGSDVERRLRSNIIEFICSNNYEPCLQRAQEMYYEWRVNGVLAPNLLGPALRYGIRRINQTSDWDYLWNKYLKTTSTVVKLSYLNALSFTSNPQLIKRLLEHSMNETLVRKQDYLSVLNYIIANPDGLPVMWDYYRSQYEMLGQRLSVAQLGTVVNNMCNYFSDENKRKEVKLFFDANPKGVTEKERKRALETIDSNIKWINTNKRLVGDWFKAQKTLIKGSKNVNIWSKHRNRLKGF